MNYESVHKHIGPADPVTGCRLWLRCRDRFGYGRVTIEGYTYSVPRLILAEKHGPLAPGMMALHRCDNPPCCEESHLYVGSHGDNTRDMVTRKRHRYGERSPNARLRPAEVLAIRGDCADGLLTPLEIASKYGVSRNHVYNIRSGRFWKHSEGSKQ